jgi:hypothetical protein
VRALGVRRQVALAPAARAAHGVARDRPCVVAVAPQYHHVPGLGAVGVEDIDDPDGAASPEVDGDGQLLVWNSRDGVTPFVINIGSKKYQHDIPRQQGLFFDLPLPLAVLGHEGGTLLVVLNGLRLLVDPIRAKT